MQLLPAFPELSLSRIPFPRKRPLTETERNWLSSAAIVTGSVLLFAAIYQVEMSMGRWKDSLRFVLDPMETSMRYLGLSHFFVAIVYMLSSRRMRSSRPWFEFAGLLGVGLLLCAGYGRLEAVSAWIAGLLFFVYFLIHDFRDQVFFYGVNGDAPKHEEPKRLFRVLAASPLVLFGVLLCVAAPIVAFSGIRVNRVTQTVEGLSQPVRWAFALVPLAILAASLPFLRRRFARANLGGPAEFLRTNRPIFFVFLGSLLLWAVGEAVTGLPNTIVLLHVVTWYVFTDRLLRKRAATGPAPARSWAALRNTTAGFRLLHLGSAAVLILVGFVWAYGFNNDPGIVPLNLLFDPENFRFWTILHVTVSFSSR